MNRSARPAIALALTLLVSSVSGAVSANNTHWQNQLLYQQQMRQLQLLRQIEHERQMQQYRMQQQQRQILRNQQQQRQRAYDQCLRANLGGCMY